MNAMTPAERLRQIEKDEQELRRSVRGFWLQFEKCEETLDSRRKDLNALARLVALAKKGASCE